MGRTATTLVLHDEREHETHEVALDAIAELDHPGNVAMVTGIVIGGLSLIPLTLGLSTIADSYEDGSGFGYAFGVLITLVGLPPLATGLGLAIEGGLRWSSSREAAEQPYGAAGAAGSVKVLPWVAPHGEGVVGGAGVAMRF